MSLVRDHMHKHIRKGKSGVTSMSFPHRPTGAGGMPIECLLKSILLRLCLSKLNQYFFFFFSNSKSAFFVVGSIALDINFITFLPFFISLRELCQNSYNSFPRNHGECSVYVPSNIRVMLIDAFKTIVNKL